MTKKVKWLIMSGRMKFSSEAHHRKQAIEGEKALDFLGPNDWIPLKILMCARATLRIMQRFETAPGGSTTYHLSAACSDQDDDNGENIT